MVDDWSLKGKSVLRINEGSGIKDGTFCDDVDTCYINHDIEILRQKLIEDIMGRRKETGKVLLSHEDIIYIINKRFGVKE